MHSHFILLPISAYVAHATSSLFLFFFFFLKKKEKNLKALVKQFIFISLPHFAFSPSSLSPVSPQSFAYAHHHHFRHRAPPSATSPTELHQRTATDNAHHPRTGRPNATHGTRSLPPPPSTDADHNPVPPLTTNSAGTHHFTSPHFP
jgi:hypothetical protein